MRAVRMKGLAPLLLALTSVAAAIQVGWAQKSSRGFRPVIPRIWDDAAMAAILKALRPRTGLTLARVAPFPVRQCRNCGLRQVRAESLLKPPY